MSRVEIIGDATLYFGDAREVLPADLVADIGVSDPPYRLTSGGKNSGGMSGGWMDGYSNDGSPVICDIEWPEIMALLAKHVRGDLYVMANSMNVIDAGIAARAAKLRFHNLLAWNKRTATANRFYMKNLEFILYLFNGPARTINNPGDKQLIEAAQIDETKHPTEKPVHVMRRYIENSSDKGALVFDPFMGTGTTGVAALQAGRRFVGVEIDEKWFEVSCRRMERATVQAELFA